MNPHYWNNYAMAPPNYFVPQMFNPFSMPPPAPVDVSYTPFWPVGGVSTDTQKPITMSPEKKKIRQEPHVDGDRCNRSNNKSKSSHRESFVLPERKSREKSVSSRQLTPRDCNVSKKRNRRKTNGARNRAMQDVTPNERSDRPYHRNSDNHGLSNRNAGKDHNTGRQIHRTGNNHRANNRNVNKGRSQNQETFTRVTESQNNDMIVAVMAIAMALQPQNQGAPDGIELD